jgi:hypothetical protein
MSINKSVQSRDFCYCTDMSTNALGKQTTLGFESGRLPLVLAFIDHQKFRSRRR